MFFYVICKSHLTGMTSKICPEAVSRDCRIKQINKRCFRIRVVHLWYKQLSIKHVFYLPGQQSLPKLRKHLLLVLTLTRLYATRLEPFCLPPPSRACAVTN